MVGDEAIWRQQPPSSLGRGGQISFSFKSSTTEREKSRVCLRDLWAWGSSGADSPGLGIVPAGRAVFAHHYGQILPGSATHQPSQICSLAFHLLNTPGLHWKLHPCVQERLFGSVLSMCMPVAELFTVLFFTLKKKSSVFGQELTKCSKNQKPREAVAA